MTNKTLKPNSLKHACLYYYAGIHYSYSVDAIQYLADKSTTEREKLKALLTIYYMIKFHLFYPVMFNPESKAIHWNNLEQFIKKQKKTKELMLSKLFPFLTIQMEVLNKDIIPTLNNRLWEQDKAIYEKNPDMFYCLIEKEFLEEPPLHMNNLVKSLEKEIKNTENRLDLLY